jgi:hypothetical protein
MRRRVLGMLLVLVVLAGCVPAQAVEPPREAAVATPTSAPATVTPTPVPVLVAPASPAFPDAAASAPPPEPTPAATPRPAVASSAKGHEVNLAEVADFVPQYTSYTCVGASLQMARAIITGDRNERRRMQRRLWEMARDRSISRYGGANPIGWAAALNDLGLGPYRFVSRPTFDDAVRTAARAIKETGRPVGLVMWAGRHAWVMTGYEATGNLRKDKDARVSRVRVMDPLYPKGSRWGPSPAPNRLIRMGTLARQFVIRDRPDYDLGVEPGWLLILPVS